MIMGVLIWSVVGILAVAMIVAQFQLFAIRRGIEELVRQGHPSREQSGLTRGEWKALAAIAAIVLVTLFTLFLASATLER